MSIDAARLTEWRRHLHANPELTSHEAETAAFVCARLAELGIAHTTGIGGHGVVASIARTDGRNDAPSVGLRADMDALPITEATGLAHASTRPGVMHACGHDGHTVSLLGAAARLQADPGWRGTVHFIFQPAEEGGGGARAMLADGLLDRFPMQRIFGYHNWPGIAAGEVVVHDGAVMANAGRVAITLRGEAGHAAIPHKARDPVLAAAQLIVALQSVVSRSVDPLNSGVLSICMVHGGTAGNQIPDHVTLRGTMRSHSIATRDRIDAAIRRIAEGIAAAADVTAEVDLRHGAIAVVNSAAEATLAAEAAAAVGRPVDRSLPPSMAGEDFGWFLRERPGAFIWIGNGPSEGGRTLHSPHYDFNDAILPDAAAVMATIALRALG